MNKNTFLFIIFIILVFVINSCDQFSNNEVSTISITFPNNTKLMKALGAPPSNLSSYTINVSGPGMSTLEKSYPINASTVSIEVPAGSNRLIELYANNDPSSNSPVLQYIGSSTEDLKSGETKSISLTMYLSKVKLVIPDRGNNRVVQIDDISGSSWDVLDYTDMGIVAESNFAPYDIDFDYTGRIFIANNVGGSGGNFNTIYRVDNIDGDNPVNIGEVEYDNGVEYLVADRTNHFIYYSTTSGLSNIILKRDTKNFLGTVDSINIGGLVADINGLAVDDDGFLYVYDSNTVKKIDLDIPSVLTTFSHTEFSTTTPKDILVKDDYLYIGHLWGNDNWALIRANINTGQFTGFGKELYTVSNQFGDLYGVHGFVAILNKKITVIDNNMNAGNVAKLVSFDDIFGTNWTTYGIYGT